MCCNVITNYPIIMSQPPSLISSFSNTGASNASNALTVEAIKALIKQEVETAIQEAKPKAKAKSTTKKSTYKRKPCKANQTRDRVTKRCRTVCSKVGKVQRTWGNKKGCVKKCKPGQSRIKEGKLMGRCINRKKN